MSQLRQRIDTLGAQLSKLSEAGTLKLQGKTHRSVPSSSPPPGAKPGSDAPPDPDDRLADYLHYKLERSHSEAATLAAVAEVEIRLKKRLNGREARAVAGALNTSAPSGVNLNSPDQMSEAERRVGEDYSGLTPGEVAGIETEAYGWCPVAHVRSARLRCRRDPEKGDPQQQEERAVTALSPEARRERARDMWASGKTAREIGKALGVSHVQALRDVGRVEDRAA